MRSDLSWSDQVPEKDDRDNSVWDIAFSPDGSQMIVAVTNRVLVYDAIDAELINSLRGHKGTVYSVSYSYDSKMFASGGSDSTVIIWTSELEGKLKYSHSSSVQNIAFNPMILDSRILCVSWTPNGQYFALGLFNGEVSIRAGNGEQKVCIQKSDPIWTLQWNPDESNQNDILAVGCWDQTLSFYTLDGQEQLVKHIGYDPCSINYFSNGEYIVIGGSNNKVLLMTSQGVALEEIYTANSWIWTCMYVLCFFFFFT
eukprot:GSMAST32.ASY1.ANO1.111.1 assembled CDS